MMHEELQDDEALGERHVYLMGRKSFESGGTNPFKEGTKDHTVWLMGWRTSQYLESKNAICKNVNG